MRLELPNVAALIAAVSSISPGHYGAIERISADQSLRAGDLEALEDAAKDALLTWQDEHGDQADYRDGLVKIACALNSEDVPVDTEDYGEFDTGELIDQTKGLVLDRQFLTKIQDLLTEDTRAGALAKVEKLALAVDDCCRIADIQEDWSAATLMDWIGVAKAKLAIAEQTIADLEMERDAAVDSAVQAVTAAEAMARC